MRFVLISAMGLAAAITVAACGDDGADSTTTGGGATGATGASGPGGSGGSTGGAGASGGAGSAGGAGGSAGTAGAGGSGGAGPPMPDCTDAAGCQVVNDCCNCEAIPTSEAPPVCNVSNCTKSTCTADGLDNPIASCAVGQCVVGFACDHSTVGCDSPPPSCPPGQTASVNGICWGACVDATECATVGSCDQCSKDHTCVEEQTQLGPIFHCVATPAACAGNATCACMGAAVCVGSFDTCNDGPSGITCSCPTC